MSAVPRPLCDTASATFTLSLIHICGETYISKIPSFRVTDLATAMAPDLGQVEVGIREGEKLHECMVPEADSLTTYEYEKNYVIYPHMEWCDLSKVDLKGGRKVEPGFVYDSGTNDEWLTVEQLRDCLLYTSFRLE